MILKKVVCRNKTDKNYKINIARIKEVKKMDRVVSTKTLFTSNGDYHTMNEKEKRNYINNLSKEYMKNARELLESLRDK